MHAHAHGHTHTHLNTHNAHSEHTHICTRLLTGLMLTPYMDATCVPIAAVCCIQACWRGHRVRRGLDVSGHLIRLRAVTILQRRWRACECAYRGALPASACRGALLITHGADAGRWRAWEFVPGSPAGLPAALPDGHAHSTGLGVCSARGQLVGARQGTLCVPPGGHAHSAAPLWQAEHAQRGLPGGLPAKFY